MKREARQKSTQYHNTINYQRRHHMNRLDIIKHPQIFWTEMHPNGYVYTFLELDYNCIREVQTLTCLAKNFKCTFLTFLL